MRESGVGKGGCRMRERQAKREGSPSSEHIVAGLSFFLLFIYLFTRLY